MLRHHLTVLCRDTVCHRVILLGRFGLKQVYITVIIVTATLEMKHQLKTVVLFKDGTCSVKIMCNVQGYRTVQ